MRLHNTLIPALLLFSFITTSCSKRAATPTIQLISQDAPGMVTLFADGEGVIKAAAETNAKKRVINKVLFDGIASSNITSLRLPMLGGVRLSDAQKKSLDQMLVHEELDRYFQDVSWVDPKTVWGSGAVKLQRYRMTLNIDLLRHELEAQGVLRKFGI